MRRLFSDAFHSAWRLAQRLLIRPETPAPSGSAIATAPVATVALAPHDVSEIDATVVRIYRLALHRTPSKEECAVWTNQIVAGHMRLSTMIELIAECPEAVGLTPHDVSEIDAAVVRIYQLALHRTPSKEECAVWTNPILAGHMRLSSMIELIAESPEARVVRELEALAPEVSNGRFVQFTFEEILGRGPLVDEIAHWDYRFARGILARDRLVTSLFAQRAQQQLTRGGAPVLHDPSSAWVMGTDRFIKTEDWQSRAAKVPDDIPLPPLRPYPSLALAPKSEVLVSAIASLYCGGDYIRQFLENITSQSIFSFCELIIIDANSPENEGEVIRRYMERFPNIVYHRAATRIGIYEAWNVGIEMARGRYLTNTNLDDLRRVDSFERQAEILEKFPFVDVTYQDFYFSFDGRATVAKTAAVDVRSELPIVTPYNLVRSNSPHNAPMWRRTLHDDMGLFDASFRSAGDHDFWLRCVEAGKVFYKVNDPHVVYYVNPEGLSTRPNTRGVEEGQRTTREHGRKIVSQKLLCDDAEFMAELQAALGSSPVIGEAAADTPEWRYAAAQRALRKASIASRSTGAPKA